MRAAVAVFLAGVVLTAPVRAQEKLDDVIARVGDYILRFEEQMARVVAEEQYTQSLEAVLTLDSATHLGESRQYGPADRKLPSVGANNLRTRTLRSDYALMKLDGADKWVGFRDTFEVDGSPVRDRDERLQRLLGSGAIAQAAHIAEENARFNIGGDVVQRNINVPTFVLELLHPRNRDRFSYRRGGTETIAGRVGVVIEYRERLRPTITRMPDGRDQPARGTIVVDSRTGEIFRTIVTWEKVTGSVAVTFGYAPGIPVLVPTSMAERFTHDRTLLKGDAAYTNYRQFQTGGRLITP
jgi:hypothetical protein